MLDHGGKLIAASRRFDIPLEQWIDLSTGINPRGWPVPELPPSAWQRLPEVDDELEASARSYYGAEKLLPVAGSQAIIQLLPKLRKKSTVGILELSYNEHLHAWKKAGHDLLMLSEKNLRQGAPEVDVLVLCNPNNPTGFRTTPENLLDWVDHLSAKGGWLVLDEAFIDATPEMSIAGKTGQPGLIVLRSLGKFFGLAGARVGFVLAWQELIDELQDELGPWTISTPARWLAKLALRDKSWQEKTRLQLKEWKLRLRELLAIHNLEGQGESDLFIWVRHNNAKTIANQLAKQAVLVRYFENPPSLRFGLPDSDENFSKLDQALIACREHIQAFPNALYGLKSPLLEII
jgi:cobalamin biosynthetic protein CobC